MEDYQGRDSSRGGALEDCDPHVRKEGMGPHLREDTGAGDEFRLWANKLGVSS